MLAQRKSANRAAGTPEWENINVDKDVYCSLLMNDVVPTIVEKWPDADFNRRTIYIQQDGAKAHINPDNDEEWLEYLDTMGWSEKIKVYTQPANSPDTNLNDLGFFAALQALYYEECPSNAMEIITMVETAYWEFDPRKVNRIWLSYLACLNQIIINNGKNDYKLPHMNKDKLERQNRLPTTLTVADEALEHLL